MNLQSLKSRLDITTIARQLGISINRYQKAKCPFHDDGSPSLQFSKEKQIATCFSPRCDAGTMDVIDLVKRYRKWTLPEAVDWLKDEAGVVEVVQLPPAAHITEAERIKVLTAIYKTSTLDWQSSTLAQDYAKSRGIDGVEMGYNTGSFAKNADKETIKKYVALGLLKKPAIVFGKNSLVFPLKNKKGQIISLYYRSIENQAIYPHLYLNDRKGLYPSYPPIETKKLILTESIIDTATLMTSDRLMSDFCILANYGTNGGAEQLRAILSLKHSLEELIIFFDGDTSGREGAQKIAEEIYHKRTQLLIKVVDTPDGEDVNSLLETHEPEIFQHLIEKASIFIPSSAGSRTETEKKIKQNGIAKPITKPSETKTKSNHHKLNTDHPHNYTYTTELAKYAIKGGIGRNGPDTLRVTLQIERQYDNNGSRPTGKSRLRLDLYEDKQVRQKAQEAADKLGLPIEDLEADINTLTDALDDYREAMYEQENQQIKTQVKRSAAQQKKTLELLKQKSLLKKINDLIGQSGVVGERVNRLFLFIVASSYKTNYPLHALIQGSSGSGKTHLLGSIMDMMPPEDTIRLTRITESSLYNYGAEELKNKLIGIEDYDGLEEKAELAFRELQSKGMISSSTSVKDEKSGQIKGRIKTVYGPIGSLSATTRGTIYEDNMSRCFLVAVDESTNQTQSIIDYQNKYNAGMIDKSEQKAAREQLQDLIRAIKPYDVINPYAQKITLPQRAQKIRRLNELYHHFVRQITLLHQAQRSRVATDNKTLITQKEDIKLAIDILFESIVLKIDELDGALRQHYEQLKKYIAKKAEDQNKPVSGTDFTCLEVRQILPVSKSQQHRYMMQLLDLEYLRRSGGYSNRGFAYKINYWDDNEKIKAEIRQNLKNQLKNL